MKNSIFATFEGIDFCGKSVQLELLSQKIVDIGIPVTVIREPGGTQISEKVREILLHRDHMEMDPVTEFLLYSAARAQLVAEVIIPEMDKGNIILCDRYYDSSTAYQGYGRKIDLATIHTINKFATQAVSPNITYLLDIDIEESEKRKLKNNVKPDRLELETKKFFNDVRHGYLQIANDNPEQFRVIDGRKAIPEIEEEIWNHFRSYLRGV